MVEVKIKKWGNSLGVILPKEYTENQDLKENDTINLQILKQKDISHMYGYLTGKKKINSQKIKDELREDWNR